MAVGALAGVGAFAGLLAAPHPTTSTNGTTTKVATSGATKSATAAVKTPAQAPVASRQRSVAVSGGS
jgi:gas vesicle protein